MEFNLFLPILRHTFFLQILKSLESEHILQPVVYLIYPNRDPELNTFRNTGILLNTLGVGLLGEKVRIMCECCYCHVFSMFKLDFGEVLSLR